MIDGVAIMTSPANDSDFQDVDRLALYKAFRRRHHTREEPSLSSSLKPCLFDEQAARHHRSLFARASLRGLHRRMGLLHRGSYGNIRCSKTFMPTSQKIQAWCKVPIIFVKGMDADNDRGTDRPAASGSGGYPRQACRLATATSIGERCQQGRRDRADRRDRGQGVNGLDSSDKWRSASRSAPTRATRWPHPGHRPLMILIVLKLSACHVAVLPRRLRGDAWFVDEHGRVADSVRLVGMLRATCPSTRPAWCAWRIGDAEQRHRGGRHAALETAQLENVRRDVARPHQLRPSVCCRRPSSREESTRAPIVVAPARSPSAERARPACARLASSYGCDLVSSFQSCRLSLSTPPGGLLLSGNQLRGRIPDPVKMNFTASPLSWLPSPARSTCETTRSGPVSACSCTLAGHLRVARTVEGRRPYSRLYRGGDTGAPSKNRGRPPASPERGGAGAAARAGGAAP